MSALKAHLSANWKKYALAAGTAAAAYYGVDPETAQSFLAGVYEALAR